MEALAFCGTETHVGSHTTFRQAAGGVGFGRRPLILRCVENTTAPVRQQPRVLAKKGTDGDEINARFDRLRHRYHSFNRADRLLSSLAGGDAGALKTRQDEFRAKLLELCYRQLEIAMKQLDASNKSALAILHH